MKYAKLNIEPQKLLGVILAGLLRGDNRITINLNPPRDKKEGSPDFVWDGLSCWINESKFN